MSQAAIEHLEEAETALMSFLSASSAALDAGEGVGPDVLPVLLAVMRHISRAAGILHGQTMFRDSFSPHPPDPRWRCWRGFPPYCSSLDPGVHEDGYGCGILSASAPEPYSEH